MKETIIDAKLNIKKTIDDSIKNEVKLENKTNQKIINPDKSLN